MALLIVNLDRQIGNAQMWRDTVAEKIPHHELRIWPDAGDPGDIEYLAFIRPDFDILPRLPNLKAMFSRSAGVEAFIHHPKLPQVPLGKLEPPAADVAGDGRAQAEVVALLGHQRLVAEDPHAVELAVREPRPLDVRALRLLRAHVREAGLILGVPVGLCIYE